MSEKGGKATSRPALRQPLKWHIDGGKGDLAKKIVALFPPRCKKPNAPEPDDPGWLHYVEPYAGGLSVLLANDPEGISEVVNDLNQELITFWRGLQHATIFQTLHAAWDCTPFSKAEWDRAGELLATSQDKHERAYAFFVRCRQSLAGRMKGFTGITKQRTRGGMNGEVNAWLTCVEGLPAVHERLKRVLILDAQPALDVIRKHDGPRTLFYLDPPYLHETRATTGEYEHEMTDVDHLRLLEALTGIKGRFLLSGYPSIMYDRFAAKEGWGCHRFDIANNAAGGKTKRRMTEVVLTNFKGTLVPEERCG